MSWKVGIEQRKPYEYENIEVFHERDDAKDFAQQYAAGHGGIILTTNRWRLPDDSTLIVWQDRNDREAPC